MGNINATVVDIDFNSEVKSRDGSKSFKVVKFAYSAFGKENVKNIFQAALAKNQDLANDLKELKQGDKVDIEVQKNDKGFNDIIRIKKGGDARFVPTTSKAGKNDDYVKGAIKGNTVSNAVLLATHNRAGFQVSFEDLVEAADMVLKLHGHLEAMDIDTKMKADNIEDSII